MALKGILYGIRVGTDFIPCEISCELSINRDIINKSGSHAGKYRSYRYGYIDWGMTCESKAVISLLQSSTNNLINAQLTGVDMEVFISARQSNVQEFVIGGNVLIPSQVLNFSNTGYASHNITFKGTGLLYNSMSGESIIINNNPADADYPLIYNQNLW